ncbi:MAG: sodium:glutamate symporter [Clostridia bacterium BRH_c25]|nr:MAG: sodium:glutamate symporter [Clostridia bacterium BRH_c25]
MKFEVVEGLLTLNMDMVATLALSLILLLLGYQIRKKVFFFERFCIPAPVIGGLLFSILAFIFIKSNAIAFKMDTTFQSPFMIAFFTTVGLGGSFKLLKKGGILLIVYWALSAVLSISQNIIGVTLAKITGIHPMLGVMAGAVSMVGGHGAAASFGQTAEQMGISGATAVAVAAATFGLISGGLIGGPIARFLIEKNNLKPASGKFEVETFEEAAGINVVSNINTRSVMNHLALITVCMTLGTIIGGWFTKTTGFALPGYVSAMFVAVIFRNINDNVKLFKFEYQTVDIIGDVSLGIFLSMALMTLKIWELSGLAGPLFIIVVTQVLFIILFTVFICFRLFGKDFDAAIMCAGMAGHGLGATPNAMANMGAVTEKYGPAPRAMMIVPLVGAFLVDLIHIPNIIWFINLFK